MICSLIKIFASNAFDKGRPLPRFVTKHADRCAKCRYFVETTENLEILLPIEAENITAPTGLKTGTGGDRHMNITPIFVAAAAAIVIMLTFMNVNNRPSVTIDSISKDSTSAVSEILDDPDLAGIFTGSLIQDEMDALIKDAQTAVTSLRSLVELP